jgi:tetratricopeptide (TPR) repeat protein
MFTQAIAKINKIGSLQASIIITIIGFVVCFTGLSSPFRNDDTSQIVNALPVHSITHIRIFFESGTFYNGQGLAPLTGIYFRPLETTFYSLIYTIAGAHPFAYHLCQLLLCIASAFILYLVFKYSFKALLALLLAIIFLIHPLNSQVVYAIPQFSDALFFFFGILAIWLLLRFKSVKSLIPVALCLFLSLLSKETAVIFIAMAILYLFWFNRERLYKFFGIMVLPVALYLILRINAVGLDRNFTSTPIDKLHLWGRLLTAPSIMQFYLTKFIFPWRLASGYYWVNPTFSVRHFLLPLFIDSAVVSLVVYLAFVIHKKASKELFFSYMFFAIWALIGLIPYLQIAPVDMTACESWFYFSMVGWLGMIGIILVTFQSYIHPKWFVIIATVLIVIFGFRTAIRGLDWDNPISLDYKDIAASPEDFIAYKNVSMYYFNQGNYDKAKVYAEKSIGIYPVGSNYDALGVALTLLGNYPGAAQAFTTGMKYQDINILYENRAAITGGYGTPAANTQFLLSAVNNFPQDPEIWFYLAIQEYRDNNTGDAKIAISNAYDYRQYSGATPISSEVISIIYSRIMSNSPLDVNFNPSSSPL